MTHTHPIHILAAIGCILFALSQQAMAQQTFTEITSDNDSWNIPGNWAAAIPSVADAAIITGGDTARITNAAPSYTGSLTLGANATVQLRNRNAISILQTPSSIIFNDPSTISILDGSPDFPAMTLNGAAAISLGGNGAHHEAVEFDGAIGGAGALTLSGVNNDTFHFNAANSFSGGLIANSPANQGWRIEANVVGSLGSGDVTINHTVTLICDASDVIGDTAVLNLNGSKDSRKASKLILSGTDTIGAFLIDGVDQCVGTFDASTHPGIITGAGSITVTVPPGDSDGDGEPNATDCAPCDNTVFPGAPEICDGKDNDCNGIVDDGLVGCVNTMAASSTWGVGGSWSLGIMPTGGQSAVANSGVTASATTSPTFTYTGDLTLVGTAALRLQNATAVNAMGSGVKMNAGSSITIPQATGASNTTFPAIELLGDAAINAQSHHKTHTFPSVISGAGALLISNTNNTTIRITQANTFSGGLTMVNGSSRIEANANGALGTGDVTINVNTSLQIGSALTSVIDDGAALNLNGNRDNRKAAKLILNSSETVDTFFIDGIQKAAGTYDSASGLTDTGGNPLISGAGTLTVLSNPPAVAPVLVSIVDNVFGGPIYQDHPGVNYVVTFDIDMDGGTVTAADFENGGTAGITIGVVTETAAGVFAVPVTLTAPGSLILQIKAGETLESDQNVPLDTTVALPDDTTITVNAGSPPDTTITGTTGGSNSWNTGGNWDNGIPFGSANAIVGAGVTAQVSGASPVYSGNLSLQAGAVIRLNHRDFLDPVENRPVLSLGNGSTIDIRDGSPDFGPISASGAVTVQAAGNGAHHETIEFNSAVSGGAQLTLSGVNNDTFRFNTAADISELIALSPANQGWRIEAKVSGSLGTGDVTLANTVTLQVDAADVMGDGVTLHLNGVKDSRKAAKVILNASDTIQFLNFDGVAQTPGTWGSSTSAAANVDDVQFSGNGVLTVTGGATVIRIR